MANTPAARSRAAAVAGNGRGLHSLAAFAIIATAAVLIPAAAAAQILRGLVVDQTGLPLPGVRINVERNGEVIHSVTTESDGSFELSAAGEHDVIVAVLPGFETTRVSPAQIGRIVMPLAHATDVTEVTASALTSGGAAMERLGSTMTAPLAQRLPTQRPRILQSLPLLPGVVRGPDGQLRISGTRPHESSLWVDGFDVTDPVTRTTTIDLPNESVKGMAVLRDPTAATFGGALGPLASIETMPGGDTFRAGVQGFIPRPRLSHFGLGRIEGFFPRAYAGGRFSRTHYFTSAELNFERVPVPGVTSRSGRPDIGAAGITSFARLDFGLSSSHHVSVDGLFAPAHTTFFGLSPLRKPETSPTVRTHDIIAGVVDRIVLGQSDLLTVRVGEVAHGTALMATGSGDALLSPSGWSQNWFAAVDHWGVQRSAAVTWDHSGLKAHGLHTISVIAAVRRRVMNARLDELPIRVLDDDDRLLRLVEFDSGSNIHAADTIEGFGVRDLWDLTSRLQLDSGFRVDRSVYASVAPRIGVRYVLDESGRTVLKASGGRFVGYAQLGALAFGQFPGRRDSIVDPDGTILRKTSYTPAGARLELPRADGVTLDLERRITRTLEFDAGIRQRFGAQLPTVIVPAGVAPLQLESRGTSRYREMQVVVRQTWHDRAEALASYVWSSSVGEINDFGTMYTSLTTPFIQPGGFGPTAGDVPHRLRAWATTSLPHALVVSPALEWRTGFPYSAVDLRRYYAGAPNALRLPNYFSLDLTTFKTFDIYDRQIDLGFQLFNLTGHFNPRDVIAVTGSPLFQHLTNSFGATLGGYMQVRWQ